MNNFSDRKIVNARSFQYDTSTLCGIYPVPPPQPPPSWTIANDGGGTEFDATDWEVAPYTRYGLPTYLSRTNFIDPMSYYVPFIWAWTNGVVTEWLMDTLSYIYEDSGFNQYYFYANPTMHNGKNWFMDYGGVNIIWSTLNNRWEIWSGDENYLPETGTLMDTNASTDYFVPEGAWASGGTIMLNTDMLSPYFGNTINKATIPLTSEQVWLGADPPEYTRYYIGLEPAPIVTLN